MHMASGTSGRLIVHVGPHKTATSSTQYFLNRLSDHVFKKYGIRVAASDEPSSKAAAFVPNTLQHRAAPSSPPPNKMFVNDSRCDRILTEVRGWLARGENVILSAESFANFANRQRVWALLSAAVRNTTAITAVFAHRYPLAWARSMWEERNKGSFNPQSFINFLLSEPTGEVSPVLAMRLASVVGPANVASFSYDLLRERGSNPAVFLVCNATLALASAAWTTCDADLRARCADLPSKNVSPPPEALDTVRIARLAWLLACRSNGSSPTTPVERFALSARSHAVQAVAACRDASNHLRQ